jgi:integrin alpha FG-GAP repeat containing protein 1
MVRNQYASCPCSADPPSHKDSSSFVRFPDFIPDVFVEEDDAFVYYTLTGNADLHVNSERVSFPSNWSVRGLSTFFDLNSDGRIEHVFPVCGDVTCSIGAILAWNPTLRTFVPVSIDSSEWRLDQTLLCFTAQQSDQELIFPFKLRHADVDGDGFIDLLALMHDCADASAPNRWIVMRNEEIGNNTFTRQFRPRWSLPVQHDLPSNGNKTSVEQRALLGTFLDVGEDGRPDFILQSKVNGSFVVDTLPNSYMVDACFLKVMVISGRCYEDCGKAIDKTLQNPFSSYNVLGYGTNQAGQSIYFELVDSEGRLRQSCAGQMTQTADFALQMPYSVFGIGQLPNFIDTLIASVPIDNTRSDPDRPQDQVARRQTWTQIVPDSQVVVIPHPPDQPGLWRTKLFLTPSEYVLSTLITLLCICLLLAVIIYVLWRREMHEDQAEHKEYKRHWPESK